MFQPTQVFLSRYVKAKSSLCTQDQTESREVLEEYTTDRQPRAPPDYENKDGAEVARGCWRRGRGGKTPSTCLVFGHHACYLTTRMTEVGLVYGE